MNSAQISEIKAARDAIYRRDADNKREIDSLREIERQLSKACDHKNPDGSSAIEEGHFMLSCPICGWSDL